MAERSFAKEVQQLKIGDGEIFRGEGILAVTKAILESGVSYVGGYQGAPISHLMDVLADANDILEDLGVHFESSASEAAAAAMLATSMHYPLRGVATWKSTVGTNVASDALANLSSGGVKGGALIVIGEDYGEGSSILQERSHAFAMKSQIWLLDPRPNLEKIVQTVRDGFELSEASNSPVMLELRIRACHIYGSFTAKDNVRPGFTLKDARNAPKRDTNRIVLPPASFLHEHEKINKRWPAAVEFIKQRKINEFFTGSDAMKKQGIITQGGMYNHVITALRHLGLSDIYGKSDVPIYVLNATYPLIDDEVIEFCTGKDAVLMVEEGQPEHIEQMLHTILRRNDISTKLYGKDCLTMAGEYTAKILQTGIQKYLDKSKSKITPPKEIVIDKALTDKLNDVVPQRPAGFCTGCPERPIFSALTLAQQQDGERHISCDIGCHLFSILPPFNLGASTMGYGLGAASSAGLNIGTGKRTISIIGDGGFWHNGLTSGIGGAVFNNSDDVIIIVDNFYSAATGGQDILSSRANNTNRSTLHPIEEAVKGVGVTWVRRIDYTYDVAKMRDIVSEALTTEEKGPKVIVASSECMLNRQRREKPIKRNAVKMGKTVVEQRYGVDEDVCTGDHACMRISGCPSLTLKKLDDPLRDHPVAHVDSSCVACGHCGEVADAAILCPSFYRTDIVHNPSITQKTSAWLHRLLIGVLQRHYARRYLYEHEKSTA